MKQQTPLIDIRPDHWKIVQHILRKHVPDCDVWAFGSRATWKAKEFSDLDLAIISDQALPLNVSASLHDDFSESDLPWKVDVVDWATTSESFRALIERDKVVVQGGEKSVGSGWRLSNWGDEVTLQYGKAIRGYSQTHGKYRVFGSNGPIGWTSDALTQGPGVVLGRKGAYRGVEFCREPFWVIDTAYYIVPKTDLDMRWLYYAVKHYELGEVDDGSPIPSTTRAAVYMLELDIPPLAEQRAIAHILGTLDDKIELNGKQNETLEAMARALFKAWFVDFEPVRAKMEGRWQRGQSLPGLPSHLYDLFPDRLVESELGEIPEGWRVFAFGDVAQQGKGTVNPGNLPQDTFTHYSLPAFDSVQSPSIELGAAIKSNKTPVPDSAVLISKLNPHIPRIWQVGKAGVNAVCSTEFIVWIPRPPANSAFLYCLASLSEFNSAMRQLVTGTSNSHQRVKPEQLIDIGVFSAIENVIELFSKDIQSVMEQVLQNRWQSQTLAQLRDTLLPKLISGALRIKDAETFLKARGL